MAPTSSTTKSPFYCEKFDLSKCDKYDNGTTSSCVEDTTERILCESHPGIEPACFALWRNNTDEGTVLIHKGCWMSQSDIKQCSPNECVTNKPQTNKGVETFFCCCEKSNCNNEYYYNFTSSASHIDSDSATCNYPVHNKVDLLTGCLFVVVPIFFFAVIVFLGFTLYRRCRLKRYVSGDQTSSIVRYSSTKNGHHSPTTTNEPLDLIDVVARGRYGCVWKARRGDDVVAVKIFPLQAMDSWMQEQDIYAVQALASCDNILRFIGVEERGTGLNVQYFLITEYHANGSLYDFLKGHILDCAQFFHVATTMLRGLAYLHEEMIKNDSVYKPAIVHRDFKSQNVLLKADLTAVIADFGLALKCEHGRTPKDTHNQVGTHRYMAPEVLESATEFSAFAFKQIDVYAAALILWEALSRCRIDESTVVNDYKQPFEEEAGAKPTLMEIQNLVVTKKKRPHLTNDWLKHPIFNGVCLTIEEMWDMEPEARVTVGCALERLLCLQSSAIGNYAQSTSDVLSDTTPLMHIATTLNVL